MYKNTKEMAELKASRISTEEILKNVGTWKRVNSKETRGFEVTKWSTTLDEVTYEVSSMKDPASTTEEPLIMFDKGGPVTLPLHKLDFIAQAMYGGDYDKAVGFVNSYSKSSDSWLSTLGMKARELAGTQNLVPDVNFDSLVEEHKLRMMAMDKAKYLIDEEKYYLNSPLPEPKTLEDWLAEPDDETTFRIEELWPSEGTVFLVASYKAGKTTMIMNVIRCLIDGGKFLGRYDTTPVSGNVAFLNFEVNERQAKAWLRRLGILKKTKLRTWNLKGYGSPMNTAIAREKFIKSLIDHDIEVLIIDPLSGIFRKGDANSNTDVKAFLLDLDEVVLRAGVKEVLMAVHAGRDPKTPRGATTLGDHPDALWNVVKADSGKGRFFQAEGRDVYLEEEGITLEADKITLILSGQSKVEFTNENFEFLVQSYVERHSNCSAGDINSGVTGKESRVTAARKSLVEKGILLETLKGSTKTYRLA